MSVKNILPQNSIDVANLFDDVNDIQNSFDTSDSDTQSDFTLKSSSSVEYICNGSSKQFDIPFKIFNKDFIKIYIDGVLQQSGFDIIENNDGSAVLSFHFNIIAGSILLISREMSFKRNFIFQTGGPFKAEELNYELDYHASYISELNDAMKNAIVLPKSNHKFNNVLPKPQKGFALVWNENEDGFVNADISNAKKYADIAEDFYKLTEDLHKDIIDKLQNSDNGWIGAYNNIIEILKNLGIDAGKPIDPNNPIIIDCGSINSDADDNIDYGSISELANDSDDFGNLL